MWDLSSITIQAFASDNLATLQLANAGTAQQMTQQFTAAGIEIQALPGAAKSMEVAIS